MFCLLAGHRLRSGGCRPPATATKYRTGAAVVSDSCHQRMWTQRSRTRPAGDCQYVG